MSTIYRNRVRCTISNTPGAAGALTLSSAYSGYRSLGATDDGKSFDCTFEDGTTWEVRTGCVYTHSTLSLSRGTLADSSTGAAIALTSSTIVMVAAHADWANRLESLQVINLPVSGVSDGTANSAALQAAISANANVLVRGEGVYCISSPISIPSNRNIEIGQGVVLCKVNDATNACTIFQNSDMAGGNENITLSGKGTLYFNANSYAAVKAANTIDCPTLPEPMSSISALSVTSSALYTMNGLHFENVKRLRVSGLTLMMSSKYIVYGASLTDFVFEDLNLYSDDTIHPADGSTYGRDGIHVQGLSSNGVIRRIRGTTNDDFIALNVRDIDAFTSSRSVGYIRNVLVEDIRGKNQRRAGSAVHIYGGCDTATLSGGKDTAPAITSLSQSGDVVTATTAAAHGMVPGQCFDISGSNPSGYNVTKGFVVSVADSAHFTYYAASGLGAYVGSAVLKRYYMMDGLTIRNVDQSTYAGAAVALSCTTDVGSNFGVIHNPIIEDVSSVASNPNGGSGVVALDFAMLVGATIRNPRSRNATAYPICNLSVTLSSKTIGLVLIEAPLAEVPYKPDSGSGQTWISMPGSHETVCIRGGSVTIEDGGGGWRQAINVGCATGSVIVDGLSCSSAATTPVQMVRCDQTALGYLEIRNCYVNGTVILAHLGGSLTSGTCKLTGNILPARSTNPINYYGTGVSIILSGNSFGTQTAGIIYAFTTGSLIVRSAGDNEFSGSTLIGAGSSGGATAFQINSPGVDLIVDGAAAYIGTNVGNQFWNSNGAFGTGIGKYARSNAGAWVKVF